MSDLKPCPFCGGAAAVHIGGSRQWPETFICCADTSCMGYHYPQDEQPGWNHDGTAEAWNKRAPADLAAAVAEVVGELLLDVDTIAANIPHMKARDYPDDMGRLIDEIREAIRARCRP